MNREDKIGGVLYEEILNSRRPCSAAELARKVHVKEEVANKLLKTLCEVGMVAEVNGKFIGADSVPKEVPLEPMDTGKQTPQPKAVAIATGGGVSKSLVAKTETGVVQFSASQSELVKNEDAFTKIIRYLSCQSGGVKSHVIAKETGLGTSRSDVNRHLYFLEKQGILSKEGVTFKLIKHTQAEEIKVMAAQLAKTPSGKKKNDPMTDSGGDCLCPNRGSGCVHNHFTQNVYNNQYNIQVGDNNIFLDSDGPKRSDT